MARFRVSCIKQVLIARWKAATGWCYVEADWVDVLMTENRDPDE